MVLYFNNHVVMPILEIFECIFWIYKNKYSTNKRVSFYLELDKLMQKILIIRI